MELTPQRYRSFRSLLRAEPDLAGLFRRRRVPADQALLLDGRLILLTTIEYQVGAARPYVVKRWTWRLPGHDGPGVLETWLIGTGGIRV